MGQARRRARWPPGADRRSEEPTKPGACGAGLAPLEGEPAVRGAAGGRTGKTSGLHAGTSRKSDLEMSGSKPVCRSGYCFDDGFRSAVPHDSDFGPLRDKVTLRDNVKDFIAELSFAARAER